MPAWNRSVVFGNVLCFWQEVSVGKLKSASQLHFTLCSYARERVLGNAALGGYQVQDGSVYNLDGAGNLSRSVTESVLIPGVASWSTKFSDVPTTTIVGNVNSRINLFSFDSFRETKRSVFGTANTYTGTQARWSFSAA